MGGSIGAPSSSRFISMRILRTLGVFYFDLGLEWSMFSRNFVLSVTCGGDWLVVLLRCALGLVLR
uniref:Uncharacterized protein n=1 Tax=Oryza brachyantha TaxID=4533 RepID=J3MHM9_ORYBR